MGDLVEELRNQARWVVSSYMVSPKKHVYWRAAKRIEELEAELALLRGAPTEAGTVAGGCEACLLSGWYCSKKCRDKAMQKAQENTT